VAFQAILAALQGMGDLGWGGWLVTFLAVVIGLTAMIRVFRNFGGFEFPFGVTAQAVAALL
jgi:hypothetical protein